jgi:hypothetical protein
LQVLFTIDTFGPLFSFRKTYTGVFQAERRQDGSRREIARLKVKYFKTVGVSLAALAFLAIAAAGPANALASSSTLHFEQIQSGVVPPRINAAVGAQSGVKMAPHHTLAPKSALKSQSLTSVPVPVVKGQLIDLENPGFFGFNGLSTVDNGNANSAYSQEIEPPDQGLCVGNGNVIEVLNDVMAVHNTKGKRIGKPLSLYTFFGIPINDFISDPRCLYDRDTKTFFLSATAIAADGSQSRLLLGVIPSSANLSAAVAYFLDTTDGSRKGCPCFDDYPLLGADANGVYIDGDEFTIAGSNFVTANIFAASKRDLAARASSVAVVAFQDLDGFAIQPAVTPAGDFDTANGGTEFFLSSLDFAGTYANKIKLWAILNTCSLPSTTTVPCLGSPSLIAEPFKTDVYVFPPPALQQAGTYPLGQTIGEPEELIDTDDDTMGQVVYEGGVLYSALTTAVSVGKQLHDGIEYFLVTPSVTKGKLGASVLDGYIAAIGLDLYYPALGASPGQARLTMSMSGATLFPSVGYFDGAGIHIAAQGVAPEDGFSGYPPTGTGVARWGDYTATTIDEAGNFWIGGEWIPSACTLAKYSKDPTCGGKRQPLTNWGTALGSLQVP